MNETATPKGQFREHWLNPRRKRFWAIVFVLLYTLIGFFLVPVLIKKLVIDLFQEDLGRQAQIAEVKVNPYVLSLEVSGFQVNDKDGVKMMAFDRFFANYQLASLFKWAFVYKELSVDAPYFHFERLQSGESRVQHLLEDIEAAFPPDPEEPTEEQASSVPRLIIQDLRINDGRVDAKDNVRDQIVEFDMAPINIHVEKLNTLPDMIGQQLVEISMPNGGSLSWSGNLKLVPFHSEGELTLKGLRLERSIAYLKLVLPLEAVDGYLSSRFKYQLGLDDQLGFTLNMQDWQTELENITIKGLSPSTEFVNIPKIVMSDGAMRYPEQQLSFKSLLIQQPVLNVWRNQDGSVNLTELVPEADATPATEQTPGDVQPWNLVLESVLLEDARLDIQDNAIEPALAVNLTDLNIRAGNVSNVENTTIPLEIAGNLQQGGSFTFDGDVVALPEVSAAIDVTTTGIPLALSQTYIKEFANIEILDGTLSSTLKIDLPDMNTFSAGGSIQISTLEVNDTLANQKLVGWSELEIDQFEFKQEQLRLSRLVFKQPFAHLTINQDRSTNVSGLIKTPAGGVGAENSQAEVETGAAGAEAETKTEAKANAGAKAQAEANANAGAKAQAEAGKNTEAGTQPMTIIVGGVQVEQGSMEFADLSLPLPFSTFITELNGTISTIATNSSTPADITMEGQVNEYGLARVGGSLNMFDPIKHSDVKVDFRNLLMSDLSPYTVEFAGREIDEGKLSLGLVYKIDGGILDGQNDIVLSDLVLGKKVDHPGAANLPLGLAVALLKDSEGVIQVDLPVQGDINDPEFKIGGVVWKAITNLITKIVTAPFKLLGSLIGIDSEDLGQFEFLAGRSDLTPPELEKVVQLQQALQERPELVIEISGVSDSEVDSPALKNFRLRKAIGDQIGEGLGDKDEQSLMLDEQIRNLVADMFTQQFPDAPVEELKLKHTVPPADDPEGQAELDELAYATDLWQQLLAAEVVTEQDLEALATARAEAVRDAFLASGEFDGKRLVIVASKQVSSEDGEWVVLELGIAAD